jgi:hypothetical protein
MSDLGSRLRPIVIPDDDELDLDSLELIPRGGATVMNPDLGALNPDLAPDLALSRDPPAPVLYWQPTHLPIYVRVRLDLTLTQHDFALLMLVLWLFTYQ